MLLETVRIQSLCEGIMFRTAGLCTVYADRQTSGTTRSGYRFIGEPSFHPTRSYINVPYSFPYINDATAGSYPVVNYTVIPVRVGETINIPDGGNIKVQYVGFAKHPTDPSKSVALYQRYATRRAVPDEF